MRRAALKIVESQSPDRDDRAAMGEALNRLYRAANKSIHEIVAHLSASERARLAVFCYGRAHLNAVGLAIAATCDPDHLVAASHSPTAGRMLYMQSREVPAPERAIPGRRSITLASAAGSTFAARAAQAPVELSA
jgi:hypothetical protein